MFASRYCGRRAVATGIVALTIVLAPLTASAAAGDIHPFAGRTNGVAYNDWIIAPVGGYSGDGGRALDALLNGPRDVVGDDAGNAYIADTGNDAIRVVDPAGTIATRIRVGVPVAMTIGLDGMLYVATGRTPTAGSNQVLRVRGNGLELVAGNGTSRATGDGGQASAAGIDPRAIAFDGAGNLYIADTSNHRVRRVGADGVITTYAGTGAMPDGSCAGNSGDGGHGFAAGICSPAALAFDSAGRLLIASEGPPALIRRVDQSGFISTVAGSGTCAADWAFGLDARNTDLCSIRGLAVDARDNVFFSTIRGRAASHIARIDGSTGRVTRVAGLGCEVEVATGFAGCFSGDGGPAVIAGLNAASGIRFAASGDLLVADTGNHAVRLVEASGFLSFAPAELAFGDQEIGVVSVGRTATVTNTGTIPAHVSSTRLEGGNPADFLLQLDDCAGRTLLPGRNCRLIVAFRPGATGLRTASLRLVSDAAEAPETPATVALSGNGIAVPRLRVSPNPVVFGNHRIGTTTTRAVTVTSVGSLPVSIASAAIAPESVPDYAVVTDACSGVTMAPGASCSLELTFTPVENGYRSGTLRITSNATQNPLDVALIGSAGPLLQISPLQIDFGAWPVGSTSTERAVTVANVGSDAALVAAADLGGLNPAEFAKTFDTCSSRLVLPSESCSIGLVFRPAVVGVRSARLDIVANAPATGSVVLTGTGIDATAPISRFVTADHSIVLGFAEPVLGETEDPTGGISRVTVRFTPVIGDPVQMNANLVCNQPRTRCAWSVRLPLTLIGPTLAHAFARDAAGNVEVPGPTISLIII